MRSGYGWFSWGPQSICFRRHEAVDPASPGPDTLCRLSVTLRSSSSKTASALGFRVKIDGRELPIYRNELFFRPVAAGAAARWPRPRPPPGQRVAPALEVVDLPGDHFTLLDDHAPLTAHRLDAAIARAEASGEDGGPPGDAPEPVGAHSHLVSTLERRYRS